MSYCENCPHQGQKRYSFKSEGQKDILVIGSQPKEVDCRQKQFASPEYRAVLNLFRGTKGNCTIGHEFALGCIPAQKVKGNDIKRCSQRLKDALTKYKPRVLLLLGEDAAKAFGFKQVIKPLRGTITDLNIDEAHVKAVISYSAEAAYKNPGLSSSINADIKKALGIAKGIEDTPEYYELETPQTFEELMRSLEAAKAATREPEKRKLVAVDTETNSLEPHRQDTKMIAISLSWEWNHGLAFLFDHRESPFSQDQREQILRKLEEVLDPKHTATCAANAKFDYKWLCYRYGLNIPFIDYDVVLTEHVLDEDKTGEYGLKNLTRDYFPRHGGYDAQLENALKSTQKALDQEAEQKTQESINAYLQKWANMTEQDRKQLLDDWVKKRYINLPDANGLEKLKTVRQGKEKKIRKGYLGQLSKVLKKVPSVIEQHKARKATYEDLPTEVLLPYAAMDAMITRKIFMEQIGKINEDINKVKNLIEEEETTNLMEALVRHTMPLSSKIAEIEYQGIRFDREKAGKYLQSIDDALPKYKEKIFSDIGREFNLSPSAPDLKKVLFEEKGYKPTNHTNTKAPATDESALKALYAEHQDQFLMDLLACRKIEKARNTYISNWLRQSEYDGRLHFSLKQHGTATYRLSADKGLQNTPAYIPEADLNMKALFIPDSEDYEFYDLDIANAELRVLCAYSQDEALIEAFNQGMDIHSLTASKLSEYSYDEIKAAKEDKTSELNKLRQLGKKINFGTVYAITPKGLKDQLSSESGINLSEDEAREYQNKFFEEYPGIENYMKETKKFVLTHKYVYTYTGRRRRFPLIGNDKIKKGKALRRAVNARIQTTSADIVNTNLVDLDNAIKPLGGRVILTVHDSILFQLPKGTTGVNEILDQVIKEKTKERYPWLPVEWKYDLGKGPNYGECK